MKHLVRTLFEVVHRVAQVGTLHVVDVDHVLLFISANRQRFRIRAGISVTIDRDHFVRRLNLSPVRHILHGLRIRKLRVRILLQILHRVAVQITLVFDSYNGRAIRPNFLLFKRLGSKALHSISLRIGRLANRAFERLIRIVGILNIGCAVYGLKAMLNSVGSLIELEVQLQHQRAVAGDNAGKHVVLVIRFEHVLVVFLSRLIVGGNGNFRVRGGRALVAAVERVSAIAVLIVELDGVLGVGVRRPDGVEDIFAAIIQQHFLTQSESVALSIAGSVPAGQGVASAGKGILALGGDGFVIGAGHTLAWAVAAVGLIDQRSVAGTRAPHAGEGHIALDLVLIAGLVGVLAIRPAEEVLTVRRNQLIGGHQVGIAVFRILLAIRRSRHIALAGYVGNGEGAVLGVVGVEGDVAVNLGINVEGVTGAFRAGAPAAPGIAGLVGHDLFLKLIQLCGNRIAIGNIADGFSSATLNGHAYIAGKGRLNPLGVDSNTIHGHGFAFEFIFLFAFRVNKPTGENIPFLARGGIRSVELNVSICDALLILIGF